MTKARLMIAIGGVGALAACGRLLWLMTGFGRWAAYSAEKKK